MPSFVFSHQDDSPLVPASGYAAGRWGNWIMKIPWAGDCSFFSLVAGRIPSGSQGGSVQCLIQRAQTYVISILFSKRKKKGRFLAIFKQLQHSLVGGGNWRKCFVSGNLDSEYLSTGLCWVMLSPDSEPSAQGEFTGTPGGLFPQCGALCLRAFSWMPEALGSCALCPVLDYKQPGRWSDSRSGWAGWRAEAPQQVLMLPKSFCAGP